MVVKKYYTLKHAHFTLLIYNNFLEQLFSVKKYQIKSNLSIAKFVLIIEMMTVGRGGVKLSGDGYFLNWQDILIFTSICREEGIQGF